MNVTLVIAVLVVFVVVVVVIVINFVDTFVCLYMFWSLSRSLTSTIFGILYCFFVVVVVCAFLLSILFHCCRLPLSYVICPLGICVSHTAKYDCRFECRFEWQIVIC